MGIPVSETHKNLCRLLFAVKGYWYTTARSFIIWFLDEMSVRFRESFSEENMIALC